MKRSMAVCAMGMLVPCAPGLPAEAVAQDHSAHHEAVSKPRRYTRSVETYALPAVTLLDQDGAAVALSELVEPSAPVALNFIFTTCTTICPVMTATFAAMVRELGEERGDLRLVSVSIDPEYDTPEVLREYAKLWRAGENWLFLTGDRDDVVAVQRAFDAYAGNKMNHRPLNFFKARGSDEWVRLDGLAAAADLAGEYRELQHRTEEPHGELRDGR